MNLTDLKSASRWFLGRKATGRLKAIAYASLLAMGLLPSASAKEIPTALIQFDAARKQVIEQLAAQVAYCVARHDTKNPSFHGCIDWHSSAHGIWALIAYRRMSGNDRYWQLVQEALAPAGLAAERRHLASDPDFEMPYGRAWFLRLVTTYRQTSNDTSLDGMGDEVAESLVAHFRKSPPDPTATAYRSAAWALVNLFDYVAARPNTQIREFVVEAIRRHFIDAGPCKVVEMETGAQEFMSVCMTWAWLASKALSPEETRIWMEKFLPDLSALQPIVRPAGAHHSGLNFSRAWGLWEIYSATGDEKYLKSYLDHFYATYDQPLHWRGDYGAVGHWVAQFGMLATYLSYLDRPASTRRP